MEVESPTLSPLSFRRAFSCEKLFQNWECTSKLSLIVISCFSDMEDKKGKMTIFFRNTKKILWKQPFQSREINRKGGNGCFEKTRKVKWQNIPLQWYSLDNIWNLQYFGKVNFQHKKVCSSSKPKKKINLPDKFEKGSLPRLILKGFLETFQSVKSGRIRSYSGVHFPALGLNTESTKYPNAGKCGPELLRIRIFFMQWLRQLLTLDMISTEWKQLLKFFVLNKSTPWNGVKAWIVLLNAGQ